MLISIIGNNASGKTTLAKALDAQPGFTAYLESHTDRPYQALFSQEPKRYALHNQIDFLLARAEQEREIRAAGGFGVQDGGLDQDFFLYSHLFHHKGFLSDKEFDLCRRTYHTLRAGFPAPEVYIYLAFPLDTLRARLLARNRKIDLATIVTLDDLPTLQEYLDAWVTDISPLTLHADQIDLDSPEFIGDLTSQIRDAIN
jgi:deoxyadenosine/deoxycytidine kinase